MSVSEKKWWKDIFDKNPKRKKLDIHNDISAIIDFLENLNLDKDSIIKELKLLTDLETEYGIAKDGIIQVNLQTQAKAIEKLIQDYEYFQNDVDINGLRIKMIAEEFLKRVKKAGMKDMLKEKKESPVWKMQW